MPAGTHVCFRWLGSDRRGNSVLQLRLSPGLIYCSRLLLWLFAKISFQNLHCRSRTVHVHFCFAAVDGELWVGALAPPTPALSAGVIFTLSKPRSVHMLGRVAPVQSHFHPFPCSCHMVAEPPASEARGRSPVSLNLDPTSPSTLSGPLHQRSLCEIMQ